MVRQVTAKDRYARAVAAVTAWCREHRHWSFRDQHRRLSSMMRGHFAYYGVGGNSRRLRWFAHQVVRVWRKWLSRRHRGAWSHGPALTRSWPVTHCLQSGSSTDTPPGFRAAAERAETDPANAISPRREVGFGVNSSSSMCGWRRPVYLCLQKNGLLSDPSRKRGC